MEAIGYYGLALLRYALFRGRASVAEFWFFWLTNAALLLFFALVQIVGHIPLAFDIYAAALAVPSLSVAVRRLHDHDQGGGSVFIALVPVLGWIVLVYWLMQPGTPGPN